MKISVILPCLNEEEAVGKVVDDARQALDALHTEGEVIVVDNGSTDRSADVAAAHGAVVVEEPERGYGRAYLTGLARAQGDFLVMADADGTYPIGELGKFVELLENGSDLVLGSRFNGNIHDGAMPWSHRRIGNPVLTGMLNRMFGVHVSDTHCGMSAVHCRRSTCTRKGWNSRRRWCSRRFAATSASARCRSTTSRAWASRS